MVCKYLLLQCFLYYHIYLFFILLQKGVPIPRILCDLLCKYLHIFCIFIYILSLSDSTINTCVSTLRILHDLNCNFFLPQYFLYYYIYSFLVLLQIHILLHFEFFVIWSINIFTSIFLYIPFPLLLMDVSISPNCPFVTTSKTQRVSKGLTWVSTKISFAILFLLIYCVYIYTF